MTSDKLPLPEGFPRGLDRFLGEIIPQDHESDPGDTMPAQGWLTHDPLADMPDRMPAWTDAGRTPAPREEHTMAPATIAHAEIRQDFGYAADRAQTIDNFATMDTQQRLENLEGLPVRELRELHHQAAGVAEWHQQGAQDARDLSRIIGQLLRAAGDEIDPQAKAEAGMGTLR